MPDFQTLTFIIFLSVIHGRAANMGTLSMVFLRLPSTIIHELSHLFLGLVTFSGVSGFSIWPKRVGDSLWTLGSVECERLGVFSCFLVGMAPALINLPLAWWVFDMHTTGGYVMSFLLLTAAVPSIKDFEVAFSSIIGSLFWGFVAVTLSVLKWGEWWQHISLF